MKNKHLNACPMCGSFKTVIWERENPSNPSWGDCSDRTQKLAACECGFNFGNWERQTSSSESPKLLVEEFKRRIQDFNEEQEKKFQKRINRMCVKCRGGKL